jgi:hypothetical protein
MVDVDINTDENWAERFYNNHSENLVPHSQSLLGENPKFLQKLRSKNKHLKLSFDQFFCLNSVIVI